MLRDEVERYTKLSGEDGIHTPIMKIGAYLDGYDKAMENTNKALFAIQECIDGLEKHGKYHADPIRHNGEMAITGLQMALDIFDKYCGGDKNA